MNKEECFEKAKNFTNETWTQYKQTLDTEAKKKQAYAVVAECWKQFKSDCEKFDSKEYWFNPVLPWLEIERKHKGTPNQELCEKFLCEYTKMLDEVWKTHYVNIIDLGA